MQSLLVQLHLGSQDERLAIRIFFDGCMDDVVLTAGGRFLQPLDMEYCPIIGVLVQVIIQFSGVFPTNAKITLRRKYSKRTFPFPWSFFTQARPIT